MSTIIFSRKSRYESGRFYKILLEKIAVQKSLFATEGLPSDSKKE